MNLKIITLIFLAIAAFAKPISSIGFYYGNAQIPITMHSYDAIVVEADNIKDPLSTNLPADKLYAYVSIGEVGKDRAYAKEFPKECLSGKNEAWESAVIDQTCAAWPSFALKNIIAPLWQRGYRNFFLDTMDSFNIIAKDDRQRAVQADALVRVIKAIKSKYPQAKLITNRGFEVIDRIAPLVSCVVAESLFGGYDASKNRYAAVAPNDREWLATKLLDIKNRHKIPVASIDYADNEDRKLSGVYADKISELGIIPFVSNHELTAHLAGAKSELKREVLMLYDGRETVLTKTDILKFASPIIEQMGYVPVFVDVDSSLPSLESLDRYAGVVSWLFTDSVRQKSAFVELINRCVTKNIKVVFLGYFGFESEAGALAKLGINVMPAIKGKVNIIHKSAMLGLEAPALLGEERVFYGELRNGISLLRIGSKGVNSDLAAITPWGGYVLAPFVLAQMSAVGSYRWIINPREFLSKALGLPVLPIADTTTKNGKRLLMSHVDGDSFVSGVEFGKGGLAGQVMLDEVFKKYRLPVSVSIIEGEIGPKGLYPHLTSQAEPIARAIFALPHIEIASHSYSHPFFWRKVGKDGLGEGYNLPIKGYVYNEDREIFESVKYINENLAPKDKKVKMFFWTGDCDATQSVLKKTKELGLRSVNGGETTINKLDNTLTAISPIGIPKAPYFQVYAPNQNDNVYTNLWSDQFYGFKRVIETFELTDAPKRVKPVDIYYHFFSATKPSSLNALKSVYEWALKQEYLPIYMSEYVDIAESYRDVEFAFDGTGYEVKNLGKIREIKLPKSAGYPDMVSSEGVFGYSDHYDDRYIHLSGQNARLVLGQKPQNLPFLISANANLADIKLSQNGISFEASNEFTPMVIKLANVKKCTAPSGWSQKASANNIELRSKGAASAQQIRCWH